MIVLLAGACVEYQPQCTHAEGTDPIPCTGLCIAEIGADNKTFATDPADLGAVDPLEVTEDWVELFNGGADPVNLSDYELVRDDNGYAVARLPSGSVAPGKCFLLVASAERGPARGPAEISFDLNKEFGTLRLYRTEPDRCLVDRLYYDLQNPDTSYARVGRGGRWGHASPTPCGPPPLLSELVAGHTADTGVPR